MKRTITAKAKNQDSVIKSMNVKIDLDFQYLTQDEAKKRVENIKDALHDFIRTWGAFYGSQIKLS